jgi:TonB family protein
MRRMMAVGVALATAAMLGAASETSKTSKADPDWLREPETAQIRAHLSAEALKVGGRAIMRCHVQEHGALDGCAIVAETSTGLGFGDALLAMSGGFQMSPLGMTRLGPDRLVLIPYYNFPYDTGPDWLRRPTQEELAVLWPKQAAREGIGGKATITCLVDVRGAAYDCVAIAEDPPGKGFGGAAIGLSQQFQFRPAKLHGAPVISAVNVPINWRGSPDAALSSGKTLVDPAIAWTESPTFDDLAAIYPKKARAARIGGRANVDCAFGRDGRVKNCRTLMEAPSGQGFGRAAEEVAKRFLAPSTTVNGKPISDFEVQIPIVFDPTMLDAGAPPVGKPKWASLPSLEDTRAAFAQLSQSGAGTLRVVLACKVQMGGGVGDCAVEDGASADQGVAQAALTLAPHFRLTTWTVEGLPTVGATVRIPLRYQDDKTAAPAPKP